MSTVRPLFCCLGLTLALSGMVSRGAAHTRTEHPVAAPAAVAPWLDVAVTGAIGKRAVRPTAASGPTHAPVGQRPTEEPEMRRHWVDPPRHGFDFPLRGSI